MQPVRAAVPAPSARPAVREADVRGSIASAADSIRSTIMFAERELEPVSMSSFTTRYSREPHLIFRSAADARSHSEGLIDEFAAALARSRTHDPEPLRSAAARHVPDLVSESDRRASREIAMGWMTESYLGGFVWERFSRTAPTITTEPPEFFDLADAAVGFRDSHGLYIPGTSHILASSEALSHADRLRIIVHEQLHYAAWLGGGFAIRWTREGGRETVRGRVSWFHEGLTELHAQQLTRGRGHTPSVISYQMETAVGYYAQRLVGPRRLREAYLSGDFTEVRRVMDRRLGSGTFSRLLSMENGYEALVYMRERLEAAGIDYRAWRDPLAQVTLVSVEPERTGN